MKKLRFIFVCLVQFLMIAPVFVSAQMLPPGSFDSQWANDTKKVIEQKSDLDASLAKKVGDGFMYYFCRPKGTKTLLLWSNQPDSYWTTGTAGTEKENQIVGAAGENKFGEAKIGSVALCKVNKPDGVYVGVDCKEAGIFQWKDSYGSDSKRYEKKVGAELPLDIQVEQDASKWYTEFKLDGLDAKLVPFVLLTQTPFHWELGPLNGDDFDGKASFKVITKLADGSMLTPGNYDIKIKATQPLIKYGINYTKTETKIVFLKVIIDCSAQITAADKCDTASTTPAQEACQKKCVGSGFCEYKEGKCVEKPPETAGTAGATAPAGASMADSYGNAYFEKLNPPPDDYKGVLPPCAFSGTCRDTNDLVQLLINFGRGMFAIMGSFAFAFFVYGGFTIILSMGNAEKVNKGKQILTAAVIGLVVAFTAYMLVDFMLDALKVNETFKGIK